MMRYGFDLGLIFRKVGSRPESCTVILVNNYGVGVTSINQFPWWVVTPRFAWQMLIISWAL